MHVEGCVLVTTHAAATTAKSSKHVPDTTWGGETTHVFPQAHVTVRSGFTVTRTPSFWQQELAFVDKNSLISTRRRLRATCSRNACNGGTHTTKAPSRPRCCWPCGKARGANLEWSSTTLTALPKLLPAQVRRTHEHHAVLVRHQRVYKPVERGLLALLAIRTRGQAGA